MPKKRTAEEQREYMRLYRQKEPEDPNPENTIANKGGYPQGWDGVIGNMTQEARDAILKRMGQTKRG